MNTNRVNELVASMKSFPKERYMKGEQLSEMFALQKELVCLTFNDEHAATADLKVWDVKNHLEQLNRDCNGAADAELQTFQEDVKMFSNLIKAEVSGNRGESKAFRTLQYIQSKHITLKNIELSRGDLRSELDAVIVTQGCVIIVEVKNTQRRIFIDESGDYYKTGEFLRKDCNIAAKLRIKENLLRSALADEGLRDIEIRSIVAFTDNDIEIQNKCDAIKTCFVNQIAYIIDDYARETRSQSIDMKMAAEAIEQADKKEAYAPDFDVAKFKLDFATVMATLEEAAEKMHAEEMEPNMETLTEEVNDSHSHSWRDTVRRILESKRLHMAGNLAAAAAMITLSIVGFHITIKE